MRLVVKSLKVGVMFRVKKRWFRKISGNVHSHIGISSDISFTFINRKAGKDLYVCLYHMTVEIGVPPFPVPVPYRSVSTSKTAEKRKFRFMPKNGTVSVHDVSFH